jgi:hypothetical protein
MNKLNRKAFIAIFLGSSAMLWFSQTRLVQSKWLDPDWPFLRANYKLVEALCEMIIPSTNTPGAIQTQTPKFVLHFLEKSVHRNLQVIFIEGLKNVEKTSNIHVGKSFLNCTAEEQRWIFEKIEKDGEALPGIWGKVENRLLGKSFFTQLKEYTVLGYCTSEVGVKSALGYDPIPGAYKGCIAWESNRPVWYTN